eukprot:4210936-Pyramimonas_sp.AAC.1
MEHGRHVLLENPLCPQVWNLIKDELPPALIWVRCDQCAFDLRDDRGDLLQKATRFVRSAVALAYALETRCSRDHGHGQIQGLGGKSREFSIWTTDMAERILEGVKQQHEFEKLLGCETSLGIPDTVDAYPASSFTSNSRIIMGASADTHTVWHRVLAALQAAIKKLHIQCSHALRGEELARRIRTGGGSPAAISTAKLFKCELCDSQQRPPIHPIASLPKWIRFNQCLGMDVAYVPDFGGNVHAFLVMLDLATDFTALQWMINGGDRQPSPTSAHAKIAFTEGWQRNLLTSERMEIDQDAAFRLEFQTMRQDLGVPCIPIAPEEYHQHGKVERNICFFKEMATKVFRELEVRDDESARIAGYQIAQTTNRLANSKGFSQTQWVLGENPSLPASLGDINADPVVAGQVTQGSLLWHRLRLQEACEIAFHQSAKSLALRRAVLSKTRPQPGPFERGEWVHYWRIGGGKHDLHRKWQGPARVIGKDQFGYWLIQWYPDFGWTE